MKFRRWAVVGFLAVLMVFAISVLLIPGQKYDTLTTSDSGFFYGIAREIDASDGMMEKYSLSHAPTGLGVNPSNQGQPLFLVLIYRGVNAVNPSVGLADVARYYSPFLFALTLIPIFLIGREFAGTWGGCASAFFMSTMGSSIYWAKVGAFDREITQLFLGALTIFLVIRTFKARGWASLKFGVLAGLVYGLFGLTWGAGFLYMAPIVIGGLVLAVIFNFAGRLFGGGKGSIESKIWAGIWANKFLILGIGGMIVATTLVMTGLGGRSPVLWTGFIQTILGYLGISGGGELWASRYASEMAKPGPLYEGTFSDFYGYGNIHYQGRFPFDASALTAIVLVLVVLALLTVWWRRRDGKFEFRREGLLAIVWIIVLVAMVWPGKGQARFTRLWWPMVPVLAGVGVGALVSLFRWLSREPSMQDWMVHFHKPVLFAVIISLFMTPFIRNAYAIADRTTPPTEWHGSGLDAEFMETFDWLRENTPENSVVSIQWSFGHVLTGVSERATVTDGAETMAEEGKWEDEEGIVRPPDYIYTVRDSTRYIYGVDIAYLGQYRTSGRRIDVQRFPTMDEDEFQWFMRTYRDNYGCKIDYVIFSYDECKQGLKYYSSTQPANILLNAERINTDLQSRSTEDQNYVFNFGENRENIVLDTQTKGNVYLRTDDGNLYLDGYGALIVDAKGRISSYGGFYPPASTPDIQETLLVFIDESNNIVSAWLIEAVSAEIANRPVPMAVRVFEGNMVGADYLEVAHTSPNGLVKVAKVNHS